MAGTLVKTIEASLVVNAGDSRETLDDLNAQAERLAKPWEIDITALTAEAQGAVDDVTTALMDYNDAALKAEEASAKLAEVQADDSASADDLAAATDAVAESTVRALDAQIRLLAAEERAAVGAQEAGDSAEAAGDEQLAAGKKGEEGAGLMEGAWEKAKLAMLGAVVGLGYGMIKAAGFQSQMTLLSTQAGVAKSQLGSLGSGVLNLAGQVGDDPDSLAQALYHVESSFQSVGITGPKALQLVKIAAEGAATGHADLVDVTNALDATIVAGVPGIHSYSQAMGALNSIVGSGDMTMEDLAQAMGSGVMAVAKTYGQSIYQVGAALATFGDNNIRGAHAATDLRMAWQAVLDPIKTGLPLLKSIGITSSQLGDEMTHHGLTAALGLLIDHLKASKVPLSDWGQFETDVFGKKAGVGIGILISQYDRLLGKIPDIQHGAKDFGSAWVEQEHTVSQQMHDLEGASEALAIKIGEKLLPAGLAVVHWLTGFAQGLEEGRGPALAIAAVIGSVLAGVALEKLAGGIKTAEQGFESLWTAGGKVISFAGTMIGKLTAQAAATDEATVATEEQAAATDELAVAQGEADVAMDANPIGLIILGIAALVVAIIEVVKHWKDFRQWGKDALHDVADAAKDAWHFIDDEFIHPLEQGLDEDISFFERMYDDGNTALNDLDSAVEHTIGDVVGWFEKLPGRVVNALSSLGNMLYQAGAGAIHWLLNGLESVVGGVIHDAENWGHDIANALGGAFGIHFSEPSEATLMVAAGRRIPEGLAKGMLGGKGLLTAAALQLGIAASPLAHGTAAGYGSAGGGDTFVLNFNGLVAGNPHQIAEQIQQLLITLKRNRFGPGSADTRAGLGLA